MVDPLDAAMTPPNTLAHVGTDAGAALSLSHLNRAFHVYQLELR